jgi:hypothetical protein
MLNHRYYLMYDRPSVLVARDPFTGTSKWTVTRPATATGLCRVWWPAIPAGLLTLSGLALARTREGRRSVAGFPLPRLTTGRLMIAVAVLGIEAGLAVCAVASRGLVAILFPRWEWELTPTELDQLLLHGLVFLVAGVALLVRSARRRPPLDPADAAFRAS